MKKAVFVLLLGAISFCGANSNVQVVLDNEIPLPREIVSKERDVRIVIQGRAPLSLEEQKFDFVKKKPSSPKGNAKVTFPEPTALVPPGEPLFLPAGVASLEKYESAVISENPIEYRVQAMPLNDFGVAMARKAGLNYIYNPAIRGTVSGVFYNMDPIYMLHLASKANGYKLLIKDGCNLEFKKN